MIVMVFFTAVTCCLGATAGLAAKGLPANPAIGGQESFTFAITGDPRDGLDIFREQIRTNNMLSPDFVIGLGDLISGYVDQVEKIEAMWDECDSVVTGLEVPLVMVPGNHDIWDAQSQRIYERRYGPKYFSFDHNIVVRSN